MEIAVFVLYKLSCVIVYILKILEFAKRKKKEEEEEIHSAHFYLMNFKCLKFEML